MPAAAVGETFGLGRRSYGPRPLSPKVHHSVNVKQKVWRATFTGGSRPNVSLKPPTLVTLCPLSLILQLGARQVGERRAFAYKQIEYQPKKDKKKSAVPKKNPGILNTTKSR